MDCSPCLFNESCRSSASRNYCGRLRTPDRYLKNQRTKILSSVSLDKLYFVVPLPDGCERMTEVISNMNQRPEKSISGFVKVWINLNLILQKVCNSDVKILGTKKMDDLSLLNSYSRKESSCICLQVFHTHSRNSDQSGMSFSASDSQINIKIQWRLVMLAPLE